MTMDKDQRKRKWKKRKERFKRFKRNLRLAKTETHFRVFKSDLVSSITSKAKNVSLFCLTFKRVKCARYIFRKNNKRWATISSNSKITVKNPFGNVGYLYIKFYQDVPSEIFVKNKDKTYAFRCEYLHCLIDLNELHVKGTCSVEFPCDVKINKMYVFTKGNLPDWVQRWEPSCDRADLLAMSTHSDDEQLFFAGVLPLYAARNKKIQVSYFAPPLAYHRYNELLDGLWQIGIKNYPVFAPFCEGLAASMDDAKSNLSTHGTSEEDIQTYIVAIIRRFKPLVVIGQDPVNGEYGHGQHMYFAHCLETYIKDSVDPQIDPASTDIYGTYAVPKLYLHLHENNKIVLDLDTPMKELNGRTPFQKSQEGFSKHRSQYVAFFPRHLFGTIRHPIKKASQIKEYSPCRWGLAYTTVGLDTNGCDLFENVE